MLDSAQLSFEDVFVGGPPPLRIEYAEVPIELIDLDPDNPRLRYRSQLDGATHAEILLREQSTKHLKQDIKLNGLLERPYVMRHGGRYIAKEGNRRTTVFADLHKDEPEDSRWQKMPVRVLPDATTEQQMATMLAQWHVTGKDPWSAHERAGHIYYMSETLNMPDETIKTVLHMGMPAINKAVAAYKMMMERFVTVDGGAFKDQGEGKFSFFDEFHKQKYLRDRVKSDSFFESDFCRWVGEGRLPRAEDVRLLPTILQNPHAERLFRETEASSAIRIASEALEKTDPTRRSDFFKQLKSLISAGGKANVTDFRTAATVNGRQLLQDARALLESINRHADNTTIR